MDSNKPSLTFKEIKEIMHISQLKESNYLKKEDCDPPLLVTIDHLTQKNIALEGDPPDMKYVLHFKEDIKPMIVNATNAQLIARAVCSEETDDWPNHEIVLFHDPNVSYQGRLVGGIRVRAKKMKGVKPKIAPIEDELNEDDIPF